MVPMSFELKSKLDRRKTRSRYRGRRTVESPAGGTAVIQGKTYDSFCSNDYLGLANEPRVLEAFKRGADQYGVGTGASQLITGYTTAHEALEEELARFLRRERVLLFGSGYLANLGAITALIGPPDTIYEDELNHASLRDARRLSGAHRIRYAHANPRDLEDRMFPEEDDALPTRHLIATDGVFSMDGDIAPLLELSEIAQNHGAWILVDDAHGIGVLGNRGRGTCEYLGLSPDRVQLLVGTLGKAFGTSGAFVAGDRDIIETLLQYARTAIYTTAPPAAIAEASRESLRIIQDEPERREHLKVRIRQFQQGSAERGILTGASDTAIQPVLLGDDARALQVGKELEDAGILIVPIRPPTVPEGTSRLRISLSALHSEEQVERLLDTLQRVLRRHGQ
jgi:8-amino-7-oxononanoate synthase